MKLIINADDCGISPRVDEQIELFIKAKKISSATIMANREDFEGAIKLYEKYKDSISFGIHLNLTDGCPMIENDDLVQTGHYILHDGSIQYNMKDVTKRKLTVKQRKYIYLELKAQIDKLLMAGVKISHIDSHHHIHTDINILPIVIKLAKEYKIKKIRGLRNYMPLSFNKMLRNGWYGYLKTIFSKVVTTDYYTSYMDFYNRFNSGFVITDAVIELGCHPGHQRYELESKVILTSNICDLTNASLINYNEL